MNTVGMRKVRMIGGVAIALLFFGGSDLAQFVSTGGRFGPVPLVPESITVTLTAPGPVDFTLNGSISAGSVTPAWITQWKLTPSRTQVQVCIFLSGALTGTSGNTDTIPPANVLAQPDGSGPFTPLTGTACGEPDAVSISTTPITPTNIHSSRTDSAALEINESGISLSPDTYTGTLNIVAQATP